MNAESSRLGAEDYEMIDLSGDGVIRATGDGVVPIVQILQGLPREQQGKYDVLQGGDDRNQVHLRDSPFGRMVAPLFETGERIHFLSRIVSEAEKKPKTVSVPESQLEQLPTVADLERVEEDCSICLEELARSDIPE